MDSVLTKLKDDNHYYGDFGKQYLSNSDIITLMNDPKSFRKPKEMTKAMLLGRYFHTAMLEPHKIESEEYKAIHASTRNTKAYKDALVEHDHKIMMLSKEKADMSKAIGEMKGNLEFYEAIYAEENEFEVPAVAEVMGVQWKGKADIVGSDMLIDLKTTSNIKDFKYSAKKYNYDSQAYLYECFFGKPLVFYVVDKITLELGIFYPSPNFLMNGKAKVEKAVDIFNRFFIKGAKDDIHDFIIKETL